MKARRRLTVVEGLIADRTEKQRLARFKAEGRIEIAAPFVTNSNGRWFLPGAGKTEWFKDIEAGPEMVVVPSGKFMMGSPEDEPERERGRAGTESPQHEVTIPKPFAIGRCAVTVKEYMVAVHDGGCKAPEWLEMERQYNVERGSYGYRTSETGSYGYNRDDFPIAGVSWDDAHAYAAWLSEASGARYRLPSEAEWEYACRAGSITPFWWGSSITPDQANYDGTCTYKGGGKSGEYRNGTVPARHFEANPWGLYQVHGNVWEWCGDFWNDSYQGAPADGSAWTTGDGNFRVLRGGSWYDDPRILRSAYRVGYSPDDGFDYFGFRVARTLD
jgi:formylglycine-generating enzyme required for sulfatase activity